MNNIPIGYSNDGEWLGQKDKRVFGVDYITEEEELVAEDTSPEAIAQNQKLAKELIAECWNCGKVNCTCDEDTMQIMDK